MTDAHILDRPMWTALTGRQAGLAVGGGGAFRYKPDVSVLAGLQDESAASLAALAQLVPQEGYLLVGQKAGFGCPPGARIASQTAVDQLVFEGQGDPAKHSHQIVPLHPSDWPEMLALATATQPGPFLLRTPMLGEFWGVKRDGKLIAMAGERMRQGRYVEVSGICTDPDFRGQGLGKALCVHVRDRVIARGEVPYLHAYASNETALKLYRALGFHKRSDLIATVVEKA